MLIGVTPKKLFMGQVSLCAAVGCPMSAVSGPLSVSVLFGSLCFQKLCMSLSSVLPAFACGVCCCVAGCVHALHCSMLPTCFRVVLSLVAWMSIMCVHYFMKLPCVWSDSLASTHNQPAHPSSKHRKHSTGQLSTIRTLACCPATSTPTPFPHVLQIPRAISQEQIRSICGPYGEIVDLNIMPPKRDNAMGEFCVCVRRLFTWDHTVGGIGKGAWGLFWERGWSLISNIARAECPFGDEGGGGGGVLNPIILGCCCCGAAAVVPLLPCEMPDGNPLEYGLEHIHGSSRGGVDRLPLHLV